MKTIKFLILGAILTSVIYFIYDNFFSKGMLVGEYVNKNYDYEPFLPEIPYEQDTLRLFENNKFRSHFWGKGTYKIFYTLVGTEIELYYKYEFGEAVFRGSLTRCFFGEPKLLLDPDRNHYLEKRK
ncbi:hypothetical protein LPB86_03845 [Pedobacter sp. MC2016-14]|uniref:hypothetical protein n=1 Tax=Pedobacter sp. MC2016-14 TaxID=2897327 RepID=UPI001E5D3440|nr:hypothetical protein [Pedobacter sp. MC2016-14]MCD0487347.1 hypothetical protein [Pedobacter sp. MC2016-14]